MSSKKSQVIRVLSGGLSDAEYVDLRNGELDQHRGYTPPSNKPVCRKCLFCKNPGEFHRVDNMHNPKGIRMICQKCKRSWYELGFYNDKHDYVVTGVRLTKWHVRRTTTATKRSGS